MNSNYVSTFSIVARDPVTGNIAVAGGSHWFAYGTIVPHGRAEVGVVATQAESNISFGEIGLKLLSEHKNPEDVLNSLLSKDDHKESRQVLIMDNSGNCAAHTGNKNIKFASHFTEKNFGVAGNTLSNENVISGMVEFYHSAVKFNFPERIIKTLQKAQELGGDLRGKRSAALLIYKPVASEKYWNDNIYDLRIDDNGSPFEELERLYKVATAYIEMNKGDEAYFERNKKEEAILKYEKAHELYPENPEVKFWYAKLLNKMGETEQSEKIQKELFKDPSWKEFWKRTE